MGQEATTTAATARVRDDGPSTSVFARVLPPPLIHSLRSIPQIGRYTIVSAAALALDFAVYLLLTHVGWRASLAGVMGYLQGLMLHFSMSTRFVFKTSGCQKSQMRLFVEFAASGLVGLGMTTFTIAVATEILQLGVLIAKVAAVAVSFLAVFVLRRSVVFLERP